MKKNAIFILKKKTPIKKGQKIYIIVLDTFFFYFLLFLKK